MSRRFPSEPRPLPRLRSRRSAPGFIDDVLTVAFAVLAAAIVLGAMWLVPS